MNQTTYLELPKEIIQVINSEQEERELKDIILKDQQKLQEAEYEFEYVDAEESGQLESEVMYLDDAEEI